VNWLTRVIDSGADYRATLAEISDDLFVVGAEQSHKRTQFWMLLVLSSVIAAGGVIGDATPAVIGAMIVAPLATPIYGVALATSIGSRRDLRGSLLLLVAGSVVSILIGALLGFLTFDRLPIDANPQITGRTAPTLLDLVVAVATGVAGSFALVRRDVSNILAGVAIAISLVPVLAVVGIALGAWRLDLALGAFLLFLTNVAAILIAGIVVFGAAGFYRQAAKADARVKRRAKTTIAAFLIVLATLLGAASLRTLAYERWINETRAAAGDWVSGTQSSVDSVELQYDEIVVKVIGPGDTPPLEQLRLDVREDVPARVVVRLITEQGEATEL
jgi:uncharacterized hydrophobic protein (TIGR00271 family)